MVNSEGRVKVLDFGLAKFQQDASMIERSRLSTEWATSAGAIMGTAAYMSPEQAEGKALDARTDIFSLGVVFYEMATGTLPFRGDTLAAMLSSILRDTPGSVEALRPDLPRQLSRIIGQCLEKKPEARYQTARDVHNQLRALRKEVELEESGPTSASWQQPPASFGEGLPPAVVAGVVVVVALAAAAWWLIPRGNSADSATPVGPVAVNAAAGRQLIAVLPFENLGPPAKEHFAAGMGEEIRSRLAAVEGVGVTSRTTVVEYDRSGQTLGQIGAALGVDYILEGTLRWEISAEGSDAVRFTARLVRVVDDTPLFAENYDRAIENTFAVQSEIALQVLDQIGISLLESQRATPEGRGTHSIEAYEAYLRGSEYLRLADELYTGDDANRAIDLLAEAVSIDADFALAHAKLSMAHGFSCHHYFDRSEARSRLAKEAADRALELASDLPEGHLALGQHYRSGLQYELALGEYELAARGRPGDGLVYQAIAELNWHMGQTGAAVVNHERAYAIDAQRSGLYCNAGGAHRMAGEFDEAMKLHDHAIAIRPERVCPYYCLAFLKLQAEGTASA